MAKLDPDSPLPLYHQIAESLRYDLATGRLQPGDSLMPIRKAAERFGANMHTVRRAYLLLAEEGLVESRGALGTRVVAPGAPDSRSGRALRRFLVRVADEARIHGLTRHDLAHLLLRAGIESESDAPALYFVECSEDQCADHVREIEQRWSVRGRPWSLEREGEPPRGPVVATLFHYNEIRRRWPHRLSEIHFVPIRPDPSVADGISDPPRGKRVTVVVCELDDATAANIAADLSLLFSAKRFRIEARATADPGAELRSGRSPLLFPPRVWALLLPKERASPRAHKVTYLIEQRALDALGERFGLRPRASTRRRIMGA